MADGYTVKVLNSEAFEKLPFKRIQENPGNIAGAADPVNRIAYVRDTGYNDLTKATISHELDELIAQTSPHEEDGIRYKDFSQAFSSFGSKIPVIGKVAGPLLGGIGQVPDLLGAGLSKVGLPNLNLGRPSVSQFAGQVRADKLAGQMPGFGTGAGSQFTPAIRSGVDKAFNERAIPRAVERGVEGASSASAARNMVPLLSSIAAAQPQPTQQPGFWESAMSGLKNAFAPRTTGTGTGKGEARPFNLFETAGKALPALGVGMMGNLFAPKVEAPDFSGVREQLASRIGEGGSPAYDLGFGEAKRVLESDFEDLPPELLVPLQDRREEQLRSLEDAFRGAQGGVDERDQTEYGRRKDRIERDFTIAAGQLRQQHRQQQEANRLTTMQTVLNLDQAQFQQHAQLAALDVSEIMAQTGIDGQTAMDYKSLFGNISELMLRGAFPQQGLTIQTA